MGDNRNNRETGARHAAAKSDADASEAFSQDAATNRKPPGGIGNAEPLDDHNEKTRHYDGQQPPQGSGSRQHTEDSNNG